VARDPYKGETDDKSVWIRETSGCVECRLEIVDRKDREYNVIRKDGVGGERRLRMVSRQSKIAGNSVVSVKAEFLCLNVNILSPIVSA